MPSNGIDQPVSTAALPGGASPLLRPIINRSWVMRWYILLFCFGPALAYIAIACFGVGDEGTLVGQVALALGSFGALRFLSKRPLLNPVQAVVFYFHWWFAVGPVICTVFYHATGDAAKEIAYSTSGFATLMVVALGLPLYSIVAAAVLRVWGNARWYAHFALPASDTYSIRTIITLFAVGWSVKLVLFGLARSGMPAFETINFLGGTVSKVWWLAAFASVARLADFGFYGILVYLAVPSSRRTKAVWITAVALVLLNSLAAISSGWKGALVASFFAAFVVVFNWRQRVPWLPVVCLGLLYLAIVEPFVLTVRTIAESRHAQTTEDRRAAVNSVLEQGGYSKRDWRDMNIESPFRGIFPVAVKTSNRSSLLEGPWGGESIADGLSAIMPRALFPDKKDSNMGNFFARDLGVSDSSNTTNNIAITLPFEYVGNYGFVIGVLSFVFIGFFWSAGVAWLLSVPRLSTHPLTPWLILMAGGWESSTGQFVNGFKDLPFALFAMFLLRRALGKRF